MKNDIQIEQWAHMLDEAFDKRSDAEKNKDAALPSGKDAKFDFTTVIPDGMSAEDIEKTFDEIWPDWFEYLDASINSLPALELEGQQRDVDDWDVWKIEVANVYKGGSDTFADLVIDDIQERWHGKTTSLKEIIDTELERLVEEIPNEIELQALEDRGECIHKGSYHTGGYYPSY